MKTSGQNQVPHNRGKGGKGPNEGGQELSDTKSLITLERTQDCPACSQALRKVPLPSVPPEVKQETWVRRKRNISREDAGAQRCCGYPGALSVGSGLLCPGSGPSPMES